MRPLPASLPTGSVTWLEIDQGAIRRNTGLLRRMLAPRKRLMAVVKADAYGHGAAPTARSALAGGADCLGVASLAEALELRDAGIDAPLLVLGYVPPAAIAEAIVHDLTLTLFDAPLARECEREARKIGKRLKAQVKLDSGMGRMGALTQDARAFQDCLAQLPNLQLEGCYTHFSSADEDAEWTREQLRRFLRACAAMRRCGARFPLLHSANSAATLTLPASHLDMVRPGIALHGLSHSAALPLPPDFRPALSWKTIVAQLKTLPAGHSAGYGRTWVAGSPTRVAILPVGYSHGFRRLPHEAGAVLLRGRAAPLIGRVSMEKSAIDVSQIPEAQVGDEVVLLGRQGESRISAATLAQRFGSSNYEVVSALSARLPRLHLNSSST